MNGFSDEERHLRIDRLRGILDEEGHEHLMVLSRENLRYLSGFTGDNGLLVVSPDRLILVTDSRYAEQAERELAGLKTGNDTDVVIYDSSMAASAMGLVPDRATCAFEPNCEYSFYQRLVSEAAPGHSLVPLGGCVEKLREIKAPHEIECMKKAIGFARQGLEESRRLIVEGTTERQLAARLDYRTVLAGSEGPAFDTIVASGPNSSLPHASVTDRALAKGDSLIIDFGATYDGYRSDTTRTFFIGTPSGQMKRIRDLVAEAQAAGIDAVRPETPAAEVDRAVREVITGEGFGEKFIHSTGHGVGLQTHESPTVSSKSGAILKPGMLITIEPGIYINGVGGVRLEEMVLVTEEGCELLTGEIR